MTTAPTITAKREALPMPTYSGSNDYKTTSQQQLYAEAKAWLQKYAVDDIAVHKRRATIRRIVTANKLHITQARTALFKMQNTARHDSTEQNITALRNAETKYNAMMRRTPSLSAMRRAAFTGTIKAIEGQHEKREQRRSSEQHTAARYRAYVAAIDSATAMFEHDAPYRPDKLQVAQDVVNRAHRIYLKSSEPMRLTRRHVKTQLVETTATYARETKSIQHTSTTTTAPDKTHGTEYRDVLLIRKDDSDRLSTALNAAKLTTQNGTAKQRIAALTGAILNSTTSTEFKPAWTLNRMALVLRKYGTTADSHELRAAVCDVFAKKCQREGNLFYAR